VEPLRWSPRYVGGPYIPTECIKGALIQGGHAWEPRLCTGLPVQRSSPWRKLMSGWTSASPRSSADSVTALLYVITCSVARMEASMNRLEHVHGWFSHNKEWIEFVIATVALWLLMMIAIHELDLRSAG
jgi:hypothetical protein